MVINILKLGGLGACSPSKILNFMTSKIASGGFRDHICNVFFLISNITIMIIEEIFRGGGGAGKTSQGGYLLVPPPPK